MSQQHLYKQCPQCQRPAHLEQAQCNGCGHHYTTQWTHTQNQTQQVQVCGQCRHTMPPDSIFCGRCGFDQRQMYNPYAQQVGNRDDIQMMPGSHSAWVALFLSLFLFGIGQIYNRQIVKGVIFMVIALVSVPATFGLAWLPLAILDSVDAYCIGKKLAMGKRVGQWEIF